MLPPRTRVGLGACWLHSQHTQVCCMWARAVRACLGQFTRQRIRIAARWALCPAGGRHGGRRPAQSLHWLRRPFIDEFLRSNKPIHCPCSPLQASQAYGKPSMLALEHQHAARPPKRLRGPQGLPSMTATLSSTASSAGSGAAARRGSCGHCISCCAETYSTASEKRWVQSAGRLGARRGNQPSRWRRRRPAPPCSSPACAAACWSRCCC